MKKKLLICTIVFVIIALAITLTLILTGGVDLEKENEKITQQLTNVKLPEIDLLTNESNDLLKSDIVLPASVETKLGTVRIVWFSSHPDVIDSDGHVSRSVLKNVEVIVTPRLIYSGRQVIRESEKATFTVLVYELTDLVMPTIEFVENADTVNHVTGNLVLPNELVIEENVSGALRWTLSSTWPDKIFDDNGVISYPHSVELEYIEVIATPTLDFNGERVELTDHKVTLMVKTISVADVVEQELRHFPEMEFTMGEQSSMVRNKFTAPSSWHMPQHGLVLGITWESSNQVHLHFDGIQWKPLPDTSSQIVFLTPTLHYEVAGEARELLLEKKQVQIFIPGTMQIEDIDGQAFASKDGKYEVYFKGENPNRPSEKDFEISLNTKSTKEMATGTYKEELGGKIKLTFHSNAVARDTFNIISPCEVSVNEIDISLPQYEGNRIILINSYHPNYDAAVKDDSFVGVYDAGSFGTLTLSAIEKKSELTGFNLGDISAASFRVLENVLLLEFEKNKVYVTIIFRIYGNNILVMNQIDFIRK